MKFAAFIMTFERPAILLENIACLTRQTFPPEMILIVDNSAGDETKIAIGALDDTRIKYHKVGYNSGPAGASAIGLKILADLGYDWIYWGDDDDPPPFDDTLERILKIPGELKEEKIGLLGFRGCKFNQRTFTMEKILNHEYQKITEVDCISGGASMIVNSQVVKEGVLPDEKLFFGFEELDFALSVKDKGYKNFITGDISLQIRKSKNKGEKKNKAIKISPQKAYDSLWLDYYSYRNLLIIAFHKKSNYVASIAIILRGVLRSLLGFSKGLKYGSKNFKIVYLGIFHGLLNKFGYIVKKNI